MEIEIEIEFMIVVNLKNFLHDIFELFTFLAAKANDFQTKRSVFHLKKNSLHTFIDVDNCSAVDFEQQHSPPNHLSIQHIVL